MGCGVFCDVHCCDLYSRAFPAPRLEFARRGQRDWLRAGLGACQLGVMLGRIGETPCKILVSKDEVERF